MPEAFADVCLGGGGRYLIFHLPKLKKLAIFDVNEAKITKYIPLTEDKVSFAAGLDALVIGLPKKGVLERWSLTTFEREATASPSLKEEIQHIFMGYASNGPVVVNGAIVDLESLKSLPFTFEDGYWDAVTVLLPSGDGTVFGCQGEPSWVYVLGAGKVTRFAQGLGRHVVPGPDGSRVFTVVGVFSTALIRIDPEDAKPGYCIPAVRGNYFLSLTPAESSGKGGSLSVYMVGHQRPLAKPDIEHGVYFDGSDGEKTGVWQRILLVPQANVIVVLPRSNDQVVLHKFDIDATLEKSGADYLFVASQPPRTVKAGTKLTYSMVVKAKRRPVTYRLDNGPKGMAVSSEGVVTWAVPADAAEGDQEVILTVRDAAGQEVFHTFKLRVVK